MLKKILIHIIDLFLGFCLLSNEKCLNEKLGKTFFDFLLLFLKKKWNYSFFLRVRNYDKKVGLILNFYYIVFNKNRNMKKIK